MLRFSSMHPLRKLQYQELPDRKTKSSIKKMRGEMQYYYDPFLQVEVDKKSETISWNLSDDWSFILPNNKYYCPSCQKKWMRLYSVGNWD